MSASPTPIEDGAAGLEELRTRLAQAELERDEARRIVQGCIETATKATEARAEAAEARIVELEGEVKEAMLDAAEANARMAEAATNGMREALKDAASTFKVLQEHLKDDPKLADELPVDLHVAIHETMLACRALSTPAEKTAGREALIRDIERQLTAPLEFPNLRVVLLTVAEARKVMAALATPGSATGGETLNRAARAMQHMGAGGTEEEIEAVLRVALSGRDPAAPTSEWQDIASAPKDGSEVDLWANGRRYTDCHFHQGEWLHWAHGGVDDEPAWAVVIGATHYRPLPPAPSQERDEPMEDASPNATSQGGE